MNEKVKIILKALIDAGYQAYVVGGYVRDFILDRETYDVDISTNAEPKEVKEIFNLSNSTDDNYGSVLLKDKLFSYDITTFRKENEYKDRKPVDLEFVDNIEIDVKRRDFTINSLYMDIDGNIIDLVDGKKDIEDKIIRCVGNINDKMVEDPLRMLRAIRFSALLDFKIENNLYQYIKQSKELIIPLSYTRKKEELDLIFKNQINLNGIDLLKDCNLDNVLDIKINDIKPCSNYLGIWAQIDASDEYQFSNQEKDIIDSIKKVLEYGIIDDIVLYQYGLFNCIVAGEILGYEKAEISEIYKNLPIYSVKDIQISGEDILSILNIEPSKKVSNIIKDIEINIIHNELDNDYEAIKEFIIKNWS